MEKKFSSLNIDSFSKTNSPEHEAVNSQATSSDLSQIDGLFRGKVNLSDFEVTSLSEAWDESYNMNHKYRGYCVIFNQEEFERHLFLKRRVGTNEDRDNIESLFSSLGFKVKVYNDLSENGIKKKLNKYAYRTDHSDYDCFVLIILSHGQSGLLFGKNKPFKTEELFDDFTADNCPSLAGKPKLFFIQACRGDKLESGYDLCYNGSRDQIDGFDGCSMPNYVIPNNSDFLVCWSTVPGYFSWRSKVNGSWFIQSLVNVFRINVNRMDVLSMMTVVNRYMMLHFESEFPQEAYKKKQCTYTVSSLMRRIYLKPKT